MILLSLPRDDGLGCVLDGYAMGDIEEGITIVRINICGGRSGECVQVKYLIYMFNI